MKIDPSAISPITNRFDSEVSQAKKETVAANLKDSFVEATSDKAQLFSHASSQKLNSGSGIVSGLDVSSGQAPSFQIEKGTAVNPAGKLVDVEVKGSIVNTPKRSSYFDGKKLEQKDLQSEQDYKMDTKRLTERESFVEGKRKHDFNADSNQVTSGIDQGLLSSTSRIAAEFAIFSPAISRLCGLTGKSAQEMKTLLDQYGINPGNLPLPADQKVMSFIQDPVFAGYPPQEILKALYPAPEDRTL
jgi:hypothetical protein